MDYEEELEDLGDYYYDKEMNGDAYEMQFVRSPISYKSTSALPPFVHTLLLSSRSFITNNFHNSSSNILIGLITTLLVIILFRSDNKVRQGPRQNIVLTVLFQIKELFLTIVQTILNYCMAFLTCLDRIRLFFSRLLCSIPNPFPLEVISNNNERQNLNNNQDENSTTSLFFFERRKSIPLLKDSQPESIRKAEEERKRKELENRIIEPAFVSESDYPEGWLTYDPKHGLLVLRQKQQQTVPKTSKNKRIVKENDKENTNANNEEEKKESWTMPNKFSC